MLGFSRKLDKMMASTIDIQKELIAYFHETSNEDFINLVDSFVYGNPAEHQSTSILIEKFMRDHGIVDAFLNVEHDKKNTGQFFTRASMSQREIINNIKTSLLSLSYNRFRQLHHELN